MHSKDYKQIDAPRAKNISTRILICIIIPFITLSLFVNNINSFPGSQIYETKTINKGYCYDEAISDQSISDYLQPLEEDSVTETSIFFVETRCHDNAESVGILDKRQTCAIESAAFTNPNFTVYVLFPSQVPFRTTEQPAYVQQLMAYPNIRLRHITMAEYVKGSPLESWYGEEALKTGDFLLLQISDVLRSLTIWKFGGIYLDLDTITLKSLDNLVPFAVKEHAQSIGSAAIGSPLTGPGHEVLSLALNYIRYHFRGNVWGGIGPPMITKVLRDYCNITPDETVNEMNKTRCSGFNVYPANYFYPLLYTIWRRFFLDTADSEDVMEAVKDSYAIHIWNKMSAQEPAFVDSQQPYSRLAKQFCPRAYQQFGHEF